jgi:hypothetical protein
LENGTDYEKTIALISSAEAGHVASSTIIDIDAIFANKIEIRSLSYSEVS